MQVSWQDLVQVSWQEAGGYFPPLVMGATYDAATRSYSIGLLLLVATALVAFAFTALVLRGPSKTIQTVKA
ncbi:MAG: hypothetical protein PVSMB10_04180 [Pseudarthrobacter sp.]